jgi:hypothetical protein
MSFNAYWIGATRKSVSSNVWTWDHGESWSYTSPYTNINQNGLCMFVWVYDKYWYDRSCSNSYYYICETTYACPAGMKFINL